MEYTESKEEASFFDSASELNLLTAEHLLGISPPMNVTMESVNTVVNVL